MLKMYISSKKTQTKPWKNSY